jgi:uncharacterized RDD family membrane protein YckC
MDNTPIQTDSVKAVYSPLIRAHLFRRFVAFTVDSIVLGVIGLVLSIPFSNVFYALGENGWWIGAIIALLYFSICHTQIIRGQTAGSKLLGISVVGIDGRYLTTYKALLRDFLFLVSYFGNSLVYAYLFPLSMGSIAVGTIFSSYVTVLFVFLLFGSNRRGLHDLAVGSIVVHTKQYAVLSDDEKKVFLSRPLRLKWPLVISGLLIISGILVSILFIGFKNPLSDLLSLQQNLNTIPGAEINSINLTYFAGEASSTTLQIGVAVNRKAFTDHSQLDTLSYEIYSRTIKQYPEINQVDSIQLRFSSGYNIGIWSFNEGVSTSTGVQDLLASTTKS